MESTVSSSASLSLRTGFQAKIRVGFKFHATAVCVHPKLPRHKEDCNWDSNTNDRTGSFSSNLDKRDSAVALVGRPATTTAQPLPPATRLYTFVIAERNKKVRCFDASQKSAIVPKARIHKKVSKVIAGFVFLSRCFIYAACSEEKTIRFYNPRMELIHAHKTLDQVLFLAYNQAANSLISVSSHYITIWSIKSTVQRGTLLIDLDVLHSIEISVRSNEWVTGVTLDQFTQYLYVMVNSKVFVYNVTDGREVDHLTQICNRQVTCITWYHPYNFTIVGCKDGTVKVLNTANAIVHEFQSQYKQITCLAVYPFGPVVVASALDKSLRMYNLKTFKEVYCLTLSEQPLSMQILDDANMVTTGIDSVTLWNLNHINTTFCAISAKATTITLVYSPISQTPPRLLVRSEDDMLRILSPYSSKILTTCLPLFETTHIITVTYAPLANKLFLLLSSGEIWIVGTHVNPCVVMDIWRQEENSSEDIMCLCAVEGLRGVNRKKSLGAARESIVPGADVPFSILVSGTRNGQMLVYNLVGDVVYRKQFHFGQVTCLITDPTRNLVITGGQDKVINICIINPASASVFTTKVSFEVENVPRKIAIGLEHICIAYDDSSLHMYSFDLITGESKGIPNHNRADDHSDTITSISSINKLGLFLTSSLDSTIKVWDLQNNLIREIQFNNPIQSSCIANDQGDILLDMEDRIDIIKHHLYLPQQYLKTTDTDSEDTFDIITDISNDEDPLPFDESFNFKQNFAASHGAPDDFECVEDREMKQFHRADLVSLDGVRRVEPQAQFMQLNFAVDRWSEEWMRTRLRLSAMKRKEAERYSEEVYHGLIAKLAVITEKRRKIIESARRRIEQENLEIERRHQVLHQEFEKFQHRQEVLNIAPKYLKKSRWQTSLFTDLAPESTKDESEIIYDPLNMFKDEPNPETELISASEPILIQDEVLVDEAALDLLPLSIISELFPGTPDPEDLENALEILYEESVPGECEIEHEAAISKTESLKQQGRRKSQKTLRIPIAPDGNLPNSSINATIKEWRTEHPKYIGQGELSFPDAVRMTFLRKKNSKNKPASVPEEDKKKEQFKARLQEMLKKKQEAEKLEAEKRRAEERAQEEALKIETQDGSEEERAAAAAAAAAAQAAIKARTAAIAPPKPAPPRKKIEQIEKYPKIIDQGMTYSWFPQEEVFYPQIEKAQSIYIKKDKSKPEELRKLKVEANADALIPIMMEEFKKTSSSKIRTEIFRYITWMYEEFGVRETTTIVRAFCRYLQTNPYVEVDDEERSLREIIISYLPKFGHTQIELLPVLLMQVVSPLASTSEQALSTLFEIGLFQDLHSHLPPKIREIVQQSDAALQAEATAISAAKAEKKAQLMQPQPRTSSMITPASSTATSSLPSQNQGQSPAVLEIRNNIMSFLRKHLRKYLMRTAKDEETLTKLRESNESGMVDKQKKQNADEKEEQEIISTRLKELLQIRADVITAKNVVLPADQVGDKVKDTSGEPREEMTVKAKKGGKSKKHSSGATDDVEVARKMKNVVMAGRSKRVSITLGSTNRKDDKPVKTFTSIDELIKKTPSDPSNIPLQRNALVILQTPTSNDFINVLNLYCTSVDRRIKREEREHQEKLAREAKLAEEMRLEREKMEAMAEFLRIKEAERVARQQLLKEKMAQKETERQEALAAEQAALANKKRKKSIKLFVGETHVSRCHESRETLNNRFPEGHRHDHSMGTTMLAYHLQTMNRSMPVEHVHLDPFFAHDDYSRSGPLKRPNSKKNTVTSKISLLPPISPQKKPKRELARPPTLPIILAKSTNLTIQRLSRLSKASTWKLPSFNASEVNDIVDIIDDTDNDNQVTTSQELRYIRSSGVTKVETGAIFNSIGEKMKGFEHRDNAFKPGRKYFVVDLAEPRDIDDYEEKGNEGSHHHHKHDSHDHNHNGPRRLNKQISIDISESDVDSRSMVSINASERSK